MTSIASHLNSKREAPKPNKVFTERFKKASAVSDTSISDFAAEAKRRGVDEAFLREAHEMSARFKLTCRRAVHRALITEVDTSKDLRIALNSEHFVNGMRALNFLGDKSHGLHPDTQREIRDLVAGAYSKYPEGTDDPAFMQEVEHYTRINLLSSKLIDRHSPERIMLDAAEKALGDIDMAINEFRYNKADESIIAKFLQKRDELETTIDLCKSPGAFALNSAKPAVDTLERLADVLSKNAGSNVDGDEGVKLAAQQVARIRQRLIARVETPIAPGQSLAHEVAEVSELINACLAVCDGNNFEGVDEIRSSLAEIKQKVDGEFELLGDIKSLSNRNVERLQRELESIVGPAPLKEGEKSTYPDRWEPFLDAMNTAVTGESGNTITWLRNSMERVRGEVKQKAEVVVNIVDYDKEIVEHLDYARTTASFFTLCRGPELASPSPNAGQIQAYFTQLSSIQDALSEGNEAKGSKEIANFLKVFSEFDDEQLIDVGFVVGTSTDPIHFNFNTRLDSWQGRPPVGQIAIDQRHAVLSNLTQLNKIDQGLEREFAKLFVQAEKEKWPNEKLQSSCQVVFNDAWGEISKLRQQVIEVAGDTFERAVTDGLDEHPILTPAQQKAFGLVVESKFRQEADIRSRHEAQKTQEWQTGFVEIPVSSFAAVRLRSTDTAALSDQELAAKISAAGGDYTVAAAMYDRIAEQVAGKNADSQSVGYQDLVTILERVGPEGFGKLEIDFTKSMQRDDKGSDDEDIYYFRSEATNESGQVLYSTWDRSAGYGLRDMVDSLDDHVTVKDETKTRAEIVEATKMKILTELSDYGKLNRSHPEYYLIRQRAERFLYKYAELFGVGE